MQPGRRESTSPTPREVDSSDEKIARSGRPMRQSSSDAEDGYTDSGHRRGSRQLADVANSGETVRSGLRSPPGEVSLRGKLLTERTIAVASAGVWSAFVANSQGPPAIYGHTAAVTDGKIVLFGGCSSTDGFQNVVWVLDMMNSNWTKYDPHTSSKSSAFLGTTELASGVKSPRSVKDSDEKSSSPASSKRKSGKNNSLGSAGWIGSTASHASRIPPPCHFPVSAVHHHSLFVQGGKSNGYHKFCCRFSLRRHVWKSVGKHRQSMDALCRYGHSCVVFEDKMYIFGGYDHVGMTCDDIYMMDMGKNGRWEKLEALSVILFPNCSQATGVHPSLVQALSLDPLQSATSHASSSGISVSTSGSRLFRAIPSKFQHVRGRDRPLGPGADSVSPMQSWDLLDGKLKRPSSLVLTSADASTGFLKSVARYHHTAVVYERAMYVWGGKDAHVLVDNDLLEYHIDTCVWSVVRTIGSAPSPRYGHASVCMGSKMFVFGGFDGSGASGDLFYCDLISRQWVRVLVSACPAPRYFHTMSMWDDSCLCVIGGKDSHDVFFGDMHLFQMSGNAELITSPVGHVNAGTSLSADTLNRPSAAGSLPSSSMHVHSRAQSSGLSDLKVSSSPMSHSARNSGKHSGTQTKEGEEIYQGGNMAAFYDSEAHVERLVEGALTRSRSTSLSEESLYRAGTELAVQSQMIRSPLQRSGSNNRAFPSVPASRSGHGVSPLSSGLTVSTRAASKEDADQFDTDSAHDPRSLSVKCFCRGETRQFELRLDSSYEALRNVVALEYGETSRTWALRYEDGDGDQLTIRSDRNWIGAVKMALDNFITSSATSSTRSQLVSGLPMLRVQLDPEGARMLGESGGIGSDTDSVTHVVRSPGPGGASGLASDRKLSNSVSAIGAENPVRLDDASPKFDPVKPMSPSDGGAQVNVALLRGSSSNDSVSSGKQDSDDAIDNSPSTESSAGSSSYHGPAEDAASASVVDSGAVARSRDVNLSLLDWKKSERVLGVGAFGTVYEGINLATGELIAIKEVMLAESSRSAVHALETEIAYLRTLAHPNIVRYLGTASDLHRLYIFLELVPGGSIASLLSRFVCLPEQIVRSFTRQILNGIVYLHDQRIAHRDIKGANVLVDVHGVVKIGDFGTAKTLRHVVAAADTGRSASEYQFACRTTVGSPYWMAPEVILGREYGLEADIWSAGAVVLEMATGKPPFGNFSPEQAMYKVASAAAHSSGGKSDDGMEYILPPDNSKVSAEVRSFLSRCFHFDPANRASAKELLRHEFVAVRSNSSDSSAATSPRQSAALADIAEAMSEGCVAAVDSAAAAGVLGLDSVRPISKRSSESTPAVDIRKTTSLPKDKRDSLASETDANMEDVSGDRDSSGGGIKSSVGTPPRHFGRADSNVDMSPSMRLISQDYSVNGGDYGTASKSPARLSQSLDLDKPDFTNYNSTVSDEIIDENAVVQFLILSASSDSSISSSSSSSSPPISRQPSLTNSVGNSKLLNSSRYMSN